MPNIHNSNEIDTLPQSSHLFELWQEVEEAAKSTKWRTKRQKLAHYKRTRSRVDPICGCNQEKAASVRKEWELRQVERILKKKCYDVFRVPVRELEFVPPPHDYLLRLSRRHGRRFKKVPKIHGYAKTVSFGTRPMKVGYFDSRKDYLVGIAYVDSFKATLADGRTTYHFNGTFCEKWSEHALRRRPTNRRPPHDVDLLDAIFCVNRTAKRYRDAAASCYRARAWSFATWNRAKKEQLYGLKDRGIAMAYLTGRIRAGGRRGSYVEYRSERYCFHSTLQPIGLQLPELETDAPPLFVEAKNRAGGEVRLCDAERTLNALPEVGDDFVRNPVQPMLCEPVAVVGGGVDDDSDDEFEDYDSFDDPPP